jgi:hypoxanthine phosphoribosyltransferase
LRSGTDSRWRRNPLELDPRIGEVYLSADSIAHRVEELGAQIAEDYADDEPLLVASLKASAVFLTDLSRAIPILHGVDFIELAGYGRADTGGQRQARFLKDLDDEIAGRHILIVEDVVDTGLTLNYLCRTLALRGPASLGAVSLFDRPYRRLVEDLPVRYVGFTIPDEFFVGYGFDLDERYRNLPDLHIVQRSNGSK